MQNYLLWQMVKMTCSMSKVLDVFDQTEPELSEVNLGLGTISLQLKMHLANRIPYISPVMPTYVTF